MNILMPVVVIPRMMMIQRMMMILWTMMMFLLMMANPLTTKILKHKLKNYCSNSTWKIIFSLKKSRTHHVFASYSAVSQLGHTE